MNSKDIVKITAIVCLALMEIVNLATLRIDGAILMAISAIIGGIAGYEVGIYRGKKR